jgi:hypothetical protein
MLRIPLNHQRINRTARAARGVNAKQPFNFIGHCLKA